MAATGRMTASPAIMAYFKQQDKIGRFSFSLPQDQYHGIEKSTIYFMDLNHLAGGFSPAQITGVGCY